MIALRIVPVELADEAAAAKRRDGAGVLVPAAGSTAWMEHGEGDEGWYTVNAAVVYMMCYGGFQRHAEGRRYVRCVVADDSEIVAEVGYIGGQLVALMVSHFSSPVDETDVFEDTPLLTLPIDVEKSSVPASLMRDVVAKIKEPLRFCQWCRYTLVEGKYGWRCCKCGKLEARAA